MLDPTLLAQRLTAMAQTGLAFSKDRYDIERYQELMEIAASLVTEGVAPLVHVMREQTGYATPKVDVRALVVRDGRVLLMQEPEDGLWSLPGGWADVGDRPSLAVEREVREETGLLVRATRLLSLWDGNLRNYPLGVFHAYKLFFLCEEIGGELQTGIDSLGVGFFAINELPALSACRVVASQIQDCLRAAAAPAAATEFD